MEKGWIKIHRKMLEWEWYDDKNTKVLFLHLLIRCNHKSKKWRGNIVNPGEIIIGVEEFGKEIGLTRQQTRTSLNKLKSTNEITIRSTKSFTLVKLNNWTDYQENNQEVNQRVTNEQPSCNQAITTTKECKNERMKEYNNILFKNFLEYSDKRNIDVGFTEKKYLELREEFKNKLNWWEDVRNCLDWLYDNQKKQITIMRLRNWMKNSIKFKNETQIKKQQEYQDKQSSGFTKINSVTPIWRPPS